MEVKIGGRIISEYSKPYFIADIAANHDGDINRAYYLALSYRINPPGKKQCLRLMKMQVFRMNGQKN